jgi:hypothetical protein
MGLFAEWVMMQAATIPREGVANLFAGEGLQPEAEAGSWIFARSKGHDPKALVQRLSDQVAQPVLAGWVYDSDIAYLSGGGPGGASFELVVGVPYTDSDEDEASRFLARLASKEGRAESGSALAAWSEKNAPTPIAAEEALEILTREWSLAEEGVRTVLERLGLPDPEAVFAPRGPSAEHGVVISVPVYELATLLSQQLLRRVDRFSGPQGARNDGRTIEIELEDAPAVGAGLAELTAEVQRWVDEVGLPRATVFAGGKAQAVWSAQARSRLDRLGQRRSREG